MVVCQATRQAIKGQYVPINHNTLMEDSNGLPPYTEGEKKRIEESHTYSTEHSYGIYLIICIVLGGGFSSFVANITPQHSLASFPALLFAFSVGLLRTCLDFGVFYFLALWIMDLIRCRGGVDRPENKKAKLIINIVFGALLLLVIVSMLRFSSLKTQQDTGANNANDAPEAVAIDFKALSSSEVVKEINALPPSSQIAAYRMHSALIDQVGKIWMQNLNGKDFGSATTKILPVLLSQGWTEGPARDALSWMSEKSLVILERDPSKWCQGSDCAARSDEQIRTTLLEGDKSLSDDVVSGIFEELAIDSNTYNITP